ncbi:MBL fold metallo-hydrolase [Actinomyces minihominis]|uniref:MBL fold metallo-hydrolase n=1 Tax=Actinomyces minihominis TaxID=2002838 RepID=UPI000C078BAA|nr:MBL fold metallo-hydrolase [Actinomyces minihominis]
MRIEVVPASLFDANCYVMWLNGGQEALVVDPGPGTTSGVEAILEREGLRVGGVLLTHGHVDHVWEAAAVAGERPVYIPEPDVALIDDPISRLEMRASALGLGEWSYPADVRPLGSETFSPIEGLTMRVVPAPGHSPGSSIFLFSPTAAEAPMALSGDVIFAGSVGRSDLPGGDDAVMQETLRTLADVLDPATLLLPGHGPQTRWGTELQSNPFVLRARRRR